MAKDQISRVGGKKKPNPIYLYERSDNPQQYTDSYDHSNKSFQNASWL